jgi:hypothetical protein
LLIGTKQPSNFILKINEKENNNYVPIVSLVTSRFCLALVNCYNAIDYHITSNKKGELNE